MHHASLSSRHPESPVAVSRPGADADLRPDFTEPGWWLSGGALLLAWTALAVLLTSA